MSSSFESDFLNLEGLLDRVAQSPSEEQAPPPTMPQIGLTSSGRIPTDDSEIFDNAPSEPLTSPSGKLWLNGKALMCACPDCQAPMTVRVWLMTADCWQCATSIELSEELLREAERLLQRRRSKRPAPRPSPPARPLTAPVESAPAAPSPPPDRPRQRPSRPRNTTSPAARRLRRRISRRQAPCWNLFRDTPAWLVSLVLHVVLLILLALWTLHSSNRDYITLSTVVDTNIREGGEIMRIDPLNEIAFDLPLPSDLDLDNQRQRDAAVAAQQDALELRVDGGEAATQLPTLDELKKDIGSGSGIGRSFSARDPRIRAEIVRREGGTTLTEAAVARGLRWLAKHQEDDGRWSLHAFSRSPGCTCGQAGVYTSDSAATSLALLPFLGAGQTHLVGRYRKTVSHGLRWLMELQKEDGDLRGNSSGNAGMYAHGQGAIVLCEAYYLTGDQTLRESAQRSIDFIIKAQHPAGGWRYRPGEAGDTSVLGWQLMALQSARAARLNVPPETMELANQYLDLASSRGGSRYAYQPRRPPDHVMTAEALLCRMYLGWSANTPGLQEGVDYLLRSHPPSAERSNFYYWYYATQAMHHVGGSRWDRWNQSMREILVESQVKRGHEAGSWDPRDRHDRAGGRLYATALATCTLEVYYRHLPIFRQIELE